MRIRHTLPTANFALAFLATFTAFYAAQLSTCLAQGTAFTYQGRLNDGASPANGSYDLRFAIYDSSGGPGVVAGPLTNSPVAVSNGLFTVTLDFGSGVFTGADRWLDIAVRTNSGGAFTTLSLRHELTATPYAIHAATAAAASSAGSVAGTNITGVIALAQLPPGVVTNGGIISGNGAGLTNIDLSGLDTSGAIGWYGTFVRTATLGVGGSPSQVIDPDLNNDGWPDLVSVDSAFNALTVYTNNQRGGFSLAASLAVGSSPRGVVAVDVNGDGRVDLTTASAGTSALTVLTNNGSAGFALASSPPLGTIPFWVAAADVNGDGKVDLVSANANVNGLTVLTNDGTGGFSVSTTPSVGAGPWFVSPVDVNGDSKVDLISANYNSGAGNTLTVLTNNGSGGFVFATTVVAGAGVISLTAADVNGDGKADLVTANSQTNTLSVLTNNGTGGFALSSTLVVDNYPDSVTAGDINGDGRTDLVLPALSNSKLRVLLGNGSGVFAQSFSAATGLFPRWVAILDVNGDGRLDLASANTSDNTITVLTQMPAYTGTFSGDGSALTDAAGWRRVGADINYGDGRVGIGLTPNIAPEAKLHLRDANASITQLIETGGGVNSWAKVEFRTGDGSWNAGTSKDFLGNAFYIDKVSSGALDFYIMPAGGVYAPSFNPTSDRNAKENFAPVSPLNILDKVVSLPISKWNFKEDASTAHIGPMAQDFYAAFGVGPDDKHISTVDADGVALAAIQGLNQKLEQKLEQKETEIAELKSRLVKLETLLNQKLNGGNP